MGVNRDQRDAISNAAVMYVRGEIDSFQLDDILFNSDSPNDHTSNYFSFAMWAFYSDTDRHFNSGKFVLGSKAVELIMTWICLLKGDREIEITTLEQNRGRLFDLGNEQ